MLFEIVLKEIGLTIMLHIKSMAFLEYLTECLYFSVTMVNKNNIYSLDCMAWFW